MKIQRVKEFSSVRVMNEYLQRFECEVETLTEQGEALIAVINYPVFPPISRRRESETGGKS